MLRLFPLAAMVFLLVQPLCSAETVLLRNPGFEGEAGFAVPGGSEQLPGDHTWIYQAIGEIQAPVYWFPFWKTGPVVNEPEREYRRPEYKVTHPRAPWLSPPRIDSGSHSYQFFGSFGAIDAGLYQPVKAMPGQVYRFGARGHSWTTCGDDITRSGECAAEIWDSTQATLRVGIDPTGGTDYASDNVVWGEGIHAYDRFEDIPPVEAEAQGFSITVYIRSTFRWGYKHNDTFIDSSWLQEAGKDR